MRKYFPETSTTERSLKNKFHEVDMGLNALERAKCTKDWNEITKTFKESLVEYNTQEEGWRSPRWSVGIKSNKQG